MRPSSYCITVKIPDDDWTLLFHGYTGAVDLVQDRVARVLQDPFRRLDATPMLISEQTFSLLRKRGYVTDRSHEEEKAFVRDLGERVHRIMRKHAPCGFLIIPTYSCNLRCAYCYEKLLRRNTREWLTKCMDKEMVDCAFEAMETLDPVSKKHKSLSFYGGEPFQKENREIVEYIFRQARQKGFTMFSAITNGVDLDHYLDLLGPDGKIRFIQVTLDGPEGIHDKRRVLADGRGTFHQISSNITKALELKITVSVRINVDRMNIAGLSALREFFISQGWDRHPNFRGYCSPVHESIEECTGVPPIWFEGPMDMQQAITIEQNKRREPLEVSGVTKTIAKHILAHLNHQGLPRWKTGFCGSNMSMHLLDPHGDIYPCWEVVGHAEHRIGVYGKGFVSIEPSQTEQWHNRSVVRIDECARCRYLYFCGGGCEAFAHRKTGALNRPNCSDFPELFQTAALMAYEDFLHTRNTSASS